ncbi:haloacid dehalogenase type II [Thalassobacillus sp. C254]|uniref:haloacid dehalogenase type II n=1 Tax=Thalassobacillus sp. C254 TaxID=1225341 RepID=UPI0006CF53FA|nr:haloacid dehalogenase type II [Thalassobacillus sp. C254]
MVQAIVFDAYGTLFDVHSVEKKAEQLFPGNGREISERWRQKQIEYTFLRQLMGIYEPFSKITTDSLRYTCKELELELGESDEQALRNEYLNLDVFQEAKGVLEGLNDYQRVIFSNGSRDMIEPLVSQSVISSLIHKIISVNDYKQYKPVPASYQSVLRNLNVKRDEVLFVSANGWDIIGASAFGFRTAWVNRKHSPLEELDVRPDIESADLSGVLKLLNHTD